VRTVGIRELKNGLSEYVRRVRAGHGFAVTDRGQIVAELLPPRAAVADPRRRRTLAMLVQRGSLSVGARNGPGLYRALPRRLPRGRLRRLLDEARGPR